MIHDQATALAETRLRNILAGYAPAAIAVSGGVDSMTLAFLAHDVLGSEAAMFHAVSPAVPDIATERVRRYACRYGWTLNLIDAGEFSDMRYLQNPVDRCFYCKSNLYGSLAGLTDAQLLSGTNLDDLSDFRPGLRAAATRDVRHPWVEAGVGKTLVRAIARRNGLNDLAELPAAPCLSSRIQTGLPIRAAALAFVDAAETLLRDRLAPDVVRCRIRPQGVVIELDEHTLNGIPAALEAELLEALAAMDGAGGGSVSFEKYVRGSAFVRES